MKKIIIIILAILLIAIAGLVLLNRFDQPLNPDAYTLNDLPAVSFRSSNGYYILWGLSEPEAVDVQSEEYMEPFRKLFDPAARDKKFLETFDINPYRVKFGTYVKTIRKLRFPYRLKDDWAKVLNPQLDKLEEVKETCAFLLKRYRALIDSPVVEDFTYPGFSAPVPNLLALLLTAKLYTTVSTAKALKGQWQEGAADLLAQVNFARRFISHARPHVNNLIGKAVLTLSLQGLVSLLNHAQCPEAVYLQVIEGLPPLKHREYGNRNSFIFECLRVFEFLDDSSHQERSRIGGRSLRKPGFPGTLFLQTNATKNYFHDYYSRAAAYDRQEPYLWESDPLQELKEVVEAKTRGFSWRFKNPVGKNLFTTAANNVGTAIFMSNRLRCRFEMVRILAEFQLKYSPGKKVPDVLEQLESYKLPDPFSGKPYRWNSKQKVLYSIGIDGVDDGGVEKLGSLKTDIVIPVVLQ